MIGLLMSDVNRTAVHIDPDLSARLATLAARSGRTLDELAQAILRDHADTAERGAEEHADDERRWQRYLQTGECVSSEAVQSRLRQLADDAAGRQDGA